MLENYTITENSDNRFKFLYKPLVQIINLGSDCEFRIMLPPLSSIASCKAIYKQGIATILEKDVQFEIDPERPIIIAIIQLTVEDTLLLNNTLLTTSLQLKFVDENEKIFYGKKIPVKIIRSNDIPAIDVLGERQMEEDNPLKPENIMTGITILGIQGTATEDATAEESDILLNKSAYVKGNKVIGTLEIENEEIPEG